jgi:hypothetical protein
MNAKNHVHAVGFEVNLPKTLPSDQIIKRNVGRGFILPKSVLDPEQVFGELRLTNACESRPDSAII